MMKTRFNEGAIKTMTFDSPWRRSWSIRMKVTTLLLVAAFLIIGSVSPVEAKKKDYVHVEWSLMECWRIPDKIDALNRLAHHLRIAADEARSEGNDDKANRLEAAALDADIEAAIGAAHMSSGDCVSSEG